MRGLRALLLLLPMLAFAGWRPVGTVTPPVQDVQVVDAGVVLAVSPASGAAVWHVSDAGVSTQINALAGSFVGAGFYGTNCLLGLTGGGAVTPSAGCGTVTNIGAGSWQRFRLISGLPVGVAIVTSGSTDTLWSGPGAAPGWAALGFGFTAAGFRSLQTGRVGGIDYAVANSGTGLRVIVDGGAVAAVPVTGTMGWRDAALFPLSNAPAILGTTNGGTLVLLRDYRTPTAFTPTIPTGVVARYVGIGGVSGMATTFTGALLAPIPDPSRPLEVWKLRATPDFFSDRIHCGDDRSCATATDAGVVWLYENEVGPLVGLTVPQFDAGATIRLVVDAGDGDGDPVFVSWSADAGSFVAVTGVDDGTEVDFTVPVGSCNLTSIDVTVTDGFLGHERTIQVPLTIIDRGPLLTSASTLTPLAGGVAVDFTASAAGGCSLPSLSWSTSEGQTGTGGQFSWTPPATECLAGGRQVTVTTTATWPTGVPSTTSSSQVLTIAPWGAPAAPVFASPGSQASGSTVDWLSSGAEHACSGTTTGFPGTELIWTIDAGGTVALPVDGGLRVVAPATCVPLRLSASALRQVIGEDAGRLSGPSTLVVDIVPDTAPLDATTPFTMTVEGDGGLVFGSLDAGGSCLEARQLSSEVTVSSAGTPLGSAQFSTPGDWSLAVPGGCTGGTYDVTARLFEDGGFTGATAQGTVTLTATPARVGTLSVDRVDVVCGAGVRVPLTLLPVPASCGTAELTWRATSGPALVTSAGSGASLELQTEALDFSIVGQQLALEWVADAGFGNLDLATRTLELSVQPFLEATVRARPPLRREEEASSLEVTLRNTTECAVEGLSVTLPLSGGSPILESVRLDGLQAPARLTDQGLVIDGVSVPALGTASIQLSARARLLADPTVEPVASLRGYVVSSLAPVVAPAKGCGCSSFSSPACFGLLVLLVLRRRRQPPRSYDSSSVRSSP